MCSYPGSYPRVLPMISPLHLYTSLCMYSGVTFRSLQPTGPKKTLSWICWRANLRNSFLGPPTSSPLSPRNWTFRGSLGLIFPTENSSTNELNRFNREINTSETAPSLKEASSSMVTPCMLRDLPRTNFCLKACIMLPTGEAEFLQENIEKCSV